MKTKIAVLMPDDATRASFITPRVMEKLEKIGEVVYNDTSSYNPEVMKKLLVNANICVTGWGCPSLDENLLEGATELKLAAHTGGSVAPIVSPELFKCNISVISGNNLYAESVAEGTLAYILCGLRNIPFYAQNVQNGYWRPNGYDNQGLLDKKVGLVGFGAITRKLIPLLKLFRTDIVVYSNHISEAECRAYGIERAETLEEVFGTCDVISLHMSLTKDTYHSINGKLFSMIRDGALLVNTARGGVINEKELEDELLKGRFHAVLDVFEEEPLPMSSRLRGLDNVDLIPHMGGPTGDRHEYVSLALIEDMKRMLAGEELVHKVDQKRSMRMTNDSKKFGGK